MSKKIAKFNFHLADGFPQYFYAARVNRFFMESLNATTYLSSLTKKVTGFVIQRLYTSSEQSLSICCCLFISLTVEVISS